MSFYKLFLFVTLGSLAALTSIKILISSTDELADTFSTSTTSYMEREPVEVDPNETPKREKSDIELEIEKERGALADAALERQKERTENLANNEFRAEDEPEYTDDEQIVAADVEDVANPEDQDEDGKANQPRGGSGNGRRNKAERADSDADMQETDIADKEILNAVRIVRTSYVKNPEIKKRDKTVQALDLAYAPPDDSQCTILGDGAVRVGVHYRIDSFAIKGHSLGNLDQMIKLYKKCGGGKMLVLQNAEGLKDTEERMIQLRKDEVKYYLLQRRVPKDDMIFSDNS